MKNFYTANPADSAGGKPAQSMAAASERVFEFLDEEEEDITVENPVKPDHIEGSVEFSHVHFGYNPDQIIINDFSAKVKPGHSRLLSLDRQERKDYHGQASYEIL